MGQSAPRLLGIVRTGCTACRCSHRQRPSGERGIRVKASAVGRELSKPRLCKRFGDFEPACASHVDESHRAPHRYAPMPRAVPESLWSEYTRALARARGQRQDAWRADRKTASRERQRLKDKYRLQRHLLAALPVSSQDRRRLLKQLTQRHAIESRLLRRKLAKQRRLIQQAPHPGTWRHFVASRAGRDNRAIRHLQRRQREQGGWDRGRGE